MAVEFGTGGFSLGGPSAGGMTYDFLSSTPSQTGFASPVTSGSYSPFSGTPLGQGYGSNIFSNLPDYSNIFSSAARGGFASGGPITSQPMPGGSRGSSGSQRRGSQSSYGGHIPSVTPPNIEFSLGQAPTLGELELDYQTLGRRAMEANVPFAEQYKQFAPQTEAGSRALSQAGATMATGVIPRDLTGQVGRSAAALGLRTGLGGRSGVGRNILARDLGLTSLQVQQQGADLLGRSSALAQQAMQAMSPISPQQVFQTAFTQAQYNREIANQNLLNAWMSRPLPGQFDISKGQYAGFQPGSYSATKPMPPGVNNLYWSGGLAPNPMLG